MSCIRTVYQKLLARRKFGIVGYVFIMLHILCGLVFVAVVVAFSVRENKKNVCSVHDQAHLAYKNQVNQACFLRYDQTYNLPLPLYGFTLLSIGLTFLIIIIYSSVVKNRVEIEELNNKRQSDGEASNLNPNPAENKNSTTLFVFYSYISHLVSRALVAIILTILEHTYFHPKGFDVNYNCSLPSTGELNTFKINTTKDGDRILHVTSVSCMNETSSKKWTLGICMSVVNGFLAIVILVELIYLIYRRLPIHRSPWRCDSDFLKEYCWSKENEPAQV